MSFQDLHLDVSYESDSNKNQLLDNFYIPVLENSKKYFRIAGFFSSTSLSVAAEGIEGLIKNDGKMYLLISPELSEEDFSIISKSEKLENDSVLFSDFALDAKEDNLKALDNDREKQESKLENAKATLKLATDEITGCENERARLDEVLRGYEPVKKLQEERSDLEMSYKKIENEVNTFQTKRTSFIRKYTVLITLYPRIKKALALIQQKEKSGDLPPAIDKMQIKRLLEHPEDRCPICDGRIDESARVHLEKLLERIAVSSETSNYLKEIKGSLEMYVDQVAQFKGKLDELRQTEMDLSSQKEKIERRLKEIAGLLSNYNESGEQGTVNIAATEVQRTKIIKQIDLAYQNAAVARATIQSCENAIEEINKKQLDAIKKLSEYDGLRREMEVIQMLHGNFKRIQIEIMQQMKNEIQTVTWKYFDEMIWKKNTFGHISINDSYDITVYNRDNIEMTGSLSATEHTLLILKVHEFNLKITMCIVWQYLMMNYIVCLWKSSKVMIITKDCTLLIV